MVHSVTIIPCKHMPQKGWTGSIKREHLCSGGKVNPTNINTSHTMGFLIFSLHEIIKKVVIEKHCPWMEKENKATE